MASVGVREAEELLLRIGEFGSYVTNTLSEVAGEAFLVNNVSIMLLSRLDLEGPMRPNQIAEFEAMTTGGVSKLIDRMEAEGLVQRKRGVLAADQRAVLVVITKSGQDLIHRIADKFAAHLSDTEVFVKELNRLLRF